jgi:hypothetical protein
MRTFFLLTFLGVIFGSTAQTSVGLALYPTGSETGLGFRLNKDKHVSMDARVTKAGLYSGKTTPSTFISEISVLYRVVYLEKVRFQMGLGFRSDWNFTANHKHGVVVPVGVEAFPFPFLNAGLIFEVAPFYETDDHSNWNGGMRTVAGFVFYFPSKKTKTPTK